MLLSALSALAIVGLALAQVSDRLPPTQTAPISVAATTAVAMVIAAALCAVFFAKSYARRFHEVRVLGIDLQKSQDQLAYVLSVARESVWSWDVRDRNWCDVLRLDEKYLQHGGDEFVVILAELKAPVDESIAVATGVAEKIRATLGEPYHLSPNDGAPEGSAIEHRCSASIGLTLFLGQQASQDELLKQADAAMYRAKEAGRNRIQLDEPLPG